MPKQDIGQQLSNLVAGLERSGRTVSILRWSPLPHQELFLQDQTKNRLLFGGNRAGKTETGVADDVHVLRRTHPFRNHLYPPKGYPVRMRCVGVDYDRGIAQIFLPKFQQLLPPSALVNGSWEDSYHKGERMLHLEDGSTVDFMSYEQEPDKFQGVSRHHIHEDEEPPEAIHKENVLRLLDTGGTMTISETPVAQLEWIEDQIVIPVDEGTLKSWAVHRLSTLDNTHLPVDELQELQGNLTGDEAKIRLEGEYTGGTLVFPEYRPRAPFTIEDRQFQLTPEWAVYEGMDEGYAHPGAWEWIAVSPWGDIVSFAEEWHAGLVPAEWARLVKLKRLAIQQKYQLSPGQWAQMFMGTIGDPAIGQTNRQTGISTQQAYSLLGIGISIEGIVKARNSGGQNVGLSKMHGYLRFRANGQPWWRIIASECPGLASELRRARRPKASLTVQESKATSEDIRDKDNDTIDAVKYVFMATHDLRPQTSIEDDARRAVQQQVDAWAGTHRPVPVGGLRVEDAMAANRTHWKRYDGSNLEG